jgi:predicted nuclease with RNAse H fold
MSFTVVGVDCATQEERTGLAYGVLDASGALELRRVTLGTAGESAPATVAGWIASAERYVVAFDAPLGWPIGLRESLAAHDAGQAITVDPERMFRRETERFVQAELGKHPPDVGADRVARTAHAALALLAQIRAAAGAALPLAWEPGASSGAIEVYPAATLLSRGISATGYKGDSVTGRKARAAIIDRLLRELRTAVSRDVLVEDDDLLDAVLCAVAAADFARGEAIAPSDRAVAEREGWIWFRGRGQRSLFG